MLRISYTSGKCSRFSPNLIAYFAEIAHLFGTLTIHYVCAFYTFHVICIATYTPFHLTMFKIRARICSQTKYQKKGESSNVCANR